MSDRKKTDSRDSFKDLVFPAELAEISKLRARRRGGDDRPGADVAQPTDGHDLVGLAISGGGIRSSTFALGVIQALAASGAMKAMDYMSTVSGGGFIGSCLSSTLNDARFESDSSSFPLCAQTGKVEPPALTHLRNSSEYLASGGMFDRIRIPALLLRGTMNNFAIFLFIIMLAVMATQVFYQRAWGTGFESGYLFRALFVVFIVFPLAYSVFQSLWRIFFNSTWQDRNRAERGFAIWLAVFAAILVLIPTDSILNYSIEATWSELKTQWMGRFQGAIGGGNIYKWLGATAALLVFAIAAMKSKRVAATSGKLVLLALGVLGPALIFMVYLFVVAIEIDSPLVRPKPLFTLNGSDANHLSRLDGLKQLKAQFAARWMPLTDAASIYAEEPGRQWVINDADAAYRVLRHSGTDELDVAQDFEFPLDRGHVTPALRDALAVKGFTISKHPRVFSAKAPDFADFRAASAARPLAALCDGDESAPPKERVAMSKADISNWHWPGLADTLAAGPADKAVAGKDLYLWGNHSLAALGESSPNALVQVVHPSLAAEALQFASSPLDQWTRQPLQTLIQVPTAIQQMQRIFEDRVLPNDGEIYRAQRFISDATKQQDLVVVVDRALTAEHIRDPRAIIAELVQKARKTRDGHKTIRVAFLEIDTFGVATYADFRSLKSAETAGAGQKLGQLLPSGPAALLCAVRILDRAGREGAQKSIFFVGTFPGRPGQKLNEVEGMYDVPWSRVRLNGLNVVYLLQYAATMPTKPTTSAVAAASVLPVPPGPLESAVIDTSGRYLIAEKPTGLDGQFRDIAETMIARLAAASPQHESIHLQNGKFKLSREGSFVRIETRLDAASIRAFESNRDLGTFFNKTGTMKLSPRVQFFPPTEAANESGPGLRNICTDTEDTENPRRCWRIDDPYLFKVNSINGGLRILDQSKSQPWWIPASLFAVNADTHHGLQWSLLNDSTLNWPWIIVLAVLCGYFFIYDVNSTTLHRFYRDRLSKAFMIRHGSSGHPNEAKVESNDRLKLSALNVSGTAPYHLVNVALNMEASKSEGLRGRGADFFLFSKRFVGSPRVGYVSTQAMEKHDHQLDLATAMAISGGAAAPSMGSTTLAPLVFILTLLNVRLNYWLPNPRMVANRASAWKLWCAPGSWYLFREALGWLNDRTWYLNLSDGGHIENLGVYELLRRRCRTIVAIDGEADPEMRFNGLMTLERYARIDLGVSIKFDSVYGLDGLRKNGADGLSARNWAAATINYGDGETGRLYYLKLSMTGEEPEYVKDYRERNSNFPHQSTAEQFFTEAQFEAYRALGEVIGGKFCAAVIAGANGGDELDGKQNEGVSLEGLRHGEFWAAAWASGSLGEEVRK